MTATGIGAVANQTAVKHPQDFGEREFAEAIEAIRRGVWKSWTTIVDGTAYSRPGSYRCDVFLTYSSATNYETKLIKCGPNDNAVILLDTGELVTEFLAREISGSAIDSPVMREFSQGIGGDRPTEEIIRTAGLVVQACWEYTDGVHISFDDEDGCLDFHLRLRNGHLVMANVFLNGGVDASVYDDSQGTPVKLVRRLRRGQTSGEDLIELFRYGGYPGSIR